MTKVIRFLIFVVVLIAARNICAQNQITGYVYGVNRQPMSELNVELLNDYYQIVGGTRTNGAGRYSFSGMSQGRYTIRVSAGGTFYEDAEQTVELVNFSREDQNGRSITTGRERAEVDVYLKLRKGVSVETVAVFVQNVPPEAKKLYESAVSDLANNRQPEAVTELKAALEIFPKYFDALERLGTEYVQYGRPEGYQAARVLFKNAVDVNARAFKSWYGLSYSLYKIGSFSDALAAAQKAVELNGSWPYAVFLYGVLLKSVKKYDEAEKQLVKAKGLTNQPNPSIYWELATLYGNILHKYAEAAREPKLFLKARPDYKDAENVKKAIAEFEKKAGSAT